MGSLMAKFKCIHMKYMACNYLFCRAIAASWFQLDHFSL